MNEKQNRFIVSVATKKVLVFLFKKYSMHALKPFTVVSYRG